jgi:hypothetical protein
LTNAARDGAQQYVVGAEECSRRGSNKRMNKRGRKKWWAPLTKKAPYKPYAGKPLVRLCAGALGNERPYRVFLSLVKSIAEAINEARRRSSRCAATAGPEPPTVIMGYR